MIYAFCIGNNSDTFRIRDRYGSIKDFTSTQLIEFIRSGKLHVFNLAISGNSLNILDPNTLAAPERVAYEIGRIECSDILPRAKRIIDTYRRIKMKRPSIKFRHGVFSVWSDSILLGKARNVGVEGLRLSGSELFWSESLGSEIYHLNCLGVTLDRSCNVDYVKAMYDTGSGNWSIKHNCFNATVKGLKSCEVACSVDSPLADNVRRKLEDSGRLVKKDLSVFGSDHLLSCAPEDFDYAYSF